MSRQMVLTVVALVIVAALGGLFMTNPSEAQFQKWRSDQAGKAGFWTAVGTGLVCTDSQVKDYYVFSTYQHSCLGTVYQTCTGAANNFSCQDVKPDAARPAN